MKKSMQIAYNNDFAKTCKFLSAAGYDGISVNFHTDFQGKTEKEWEDAIENINMVLSETSLEAFQTHSYYYDLRISSEEVEENLELEIKRAVMASGKIGAKWCAIHPRSSVSTGFRTKETMEDNKRVFSEYLEIAKKNNTGIAIENLPVFSGIIPCMPFFSSNYEDLCNLVDSFKDESVGICWDTGHANMMSFDQADAIRFLGERIKCTHIHDNIQKQDLHFPPSMGYIDWEKIMHAFYEIGYEGPFTLETHCKYNDDDDFLKAFFKFNLAGLNLMEKYFK